MRVHVDKMKNYLDSQNLQKNTILDRDFQGKTQNIKVLLCIYNWALKKYVLLVLAFFLRHVVLGNM